MSVKVFRHFLLEFCSREFFDISDGAADANSPSTRSHRLLGTDHMLVKVGSCCAFGANQKTFARNKRNNFFVKIYQNPV
jgi:hypothetical protein